MKKLLSYCLNKWWLLPLISTTLIGLSFIFDSVGFIITGLLLVAFSVVYKKRHPLLKCNYPLPFSTKLFKQNFITHKFIKCFTVVTPNLKKDCKNGTP